MNDLFESVATGLEAPITEERPWAAFAACRDRDPDVFFPIAENGEAEAIKICQGCPVQLECLEFALEAKIRFGVWGGLNEKQRLSLYRRIA